MEGKQKWYVLRLEEECRKKNCEIDALADYETANVLNRKCAKGFGLTPKLNF